jgi:NADH dehydrogenase FAD-containing subunit
VVVGSGPTGIEGATEIKGLYPKLQVSLVTDGAFGAFKGEERIERPLRQAFRRQGIPILEHKRVMAVEEGQLRLAGGEVIPFDICLWAGGFRPLPLASDSGLAVNSLGQVLVDPYERSISHPSIYAAGDSSYPVEEPGTPVRMSLQAAITQGAQAADNLGALIAGKRQKPLSFAYYGQGIALGPKDGLAFVTYPDDRSHGPILHGRVWLAGRNFFVWLFFVLLEVERRWPGFYQWLGKGRYAAAKRRTRLAPAPGMPAQPDR